MCYVCCVKQATDKLAANKGNAAQPTNRLDSQRRKERKKEREHFEAFNSLMEKFTSIKLYKLVT